MDMRKNVCANFYIIHFKMRDELKREFRVITERKSYNRI